MVQFFAPQCIYNVGTDEKDRVYRNGPFTEIVKLSIPVKPMLNAQTLKVMHSAASSLL